MRAIEAAAVAVATVESANEHIEIMDCFCSFGYLMNAHDDY